MIPWRYFFDVCPSLRKPFLKFSLNFLPQIVCQRIQPRPIPIRTNSFVLQHTSLFFFVRVRCISPIGVAFKSPSPAAVAPQSAQNSSFFPSTIQSTTPPLLPSPLLSSTSSCVYAWSLFKRAFVTSGSPVCVSSRKGFFGGKRTPHESHLNGLWTSHVQMSAQLLLCAIYVSPSLFIFCDSIHGEETLEKCFNVLFFLGDSVSLAEDSIVFGLRLFLSIVFLFILEPTSAAHARHSLLLPFFVTCSFFLVCMERPLQQRLLCTSWSVIHAVCEAFFLRFLCFFLSPTLPSLPSCRAALSTLFCPFFSALHLHNILPLVLSTLLELAPPMPSRGYFPHSSFLSLFPKKSFPPSCPSDPPAWPCQSVFCFELNRAHVFFLWSSFFVLFRMFSFQ